MKSLKLVTIIGLSITVTAIFTFAQKSSEKRTIAVLDFTNESGKSHLDYLSKAIAESIITYLGRSREIELVERGRLIDALREMKLSLTGIVDGTTASKLGKTVGADAIILGSFIEIGGVIRINTRMIDVQTSKVIRTEQVTGETGEEIFELMDKSAEGMLSKLKIPPNSPSELKITSVKENQINISWIDNSDDEKGYKIERKVKEGTYTQIDIVGANIESYKDRHLNSNIQYYYRVRAYNTIGNSSYSNEVNATTKQRIIEKRVSKKLEAKLPKRKPKPKISKQEHVRKFGIGLNYLGISLRYSGIRLITFEVKSVFGEGFTAFGPRLYINLSKSPRTTIYLGLEYCQISGESEVQKFTGTATGVFLGLELLANDRISVLLDIGSSTVILNSKFDYISVSDNYIIGNLGINCYF